MRYTGSGSPMPAMVRFCMKYLCVRLFVYAVVSTHEPKKTELMKLVVHGSHFTFSFLLSWNFVYANFVISISAVFYNRATWLAGLSARILYRLLWNTSHQIFSLQFHNPLFFLIGFLFYPILQWNVFFWRNSVDVRFQPHDFLKLLQLLMDLNPHHLRSISSVRYARSYRWRIINFITCATYCSRNVKIRWFFSFFIVLCSCWTLLVWWGRLRISTLLWGLFLPLSPAWPLVDCV